MPSVICSMFVIDVYTNLPSQEREVDNLPTQEEGVDDLAVLPGVQYLIQSGCHDEGEYPGHRVETYGPGAHLVSSGYPL